MGNNFDQTVSYKQNYVSLYLVDGTDFARIRSSSDTVVMGVSSGVVINRLSKRELGPVVSVGWASGRVSVLVTASVDVVDCEKSKSYNDTSIHYILY